MNQGRCHSGNWRGEESERERETVCVCVGGGARFLLFLGEYMQGTIHCIIFPTF